MAHSANPQTRIAWYEARNAAVAADMVRGSYAPRVSFTAVAGPHASRSTVSAPGLRGDGESEGVGAVATLSLEWLLFDFGAREALVNAARQRTIVANIAFTAEHQNVTYQVALAFYDDVAARARSGNADRAVALALEVQASAEARLRQGIGTTVEAAQARQATAQLRLAAVQARAARADFLPKVFVSGTAAHVEGARNLTALPGGSGEWPTLNLSGTRNSATLMVGVRIPLFDGGIRSGRLEQARNGGEAAAARLEATRNRAVLEIVASENGLRSTLEANVAAEPARAAARTTVDAAFAAYRNGVGSITEVNLAQQQLLASENVRADAHAAALRAAATLALATGALGAAPD